MDSAWYYLRFADPHNPNELARRDLLNRWLPVDVYVGGSDHATGHLLYARFITKVLNDLGYLDFDEPFRRLIHQGLILGKDGRKMSKRWGNVVNPIDVSDEFGSDALRIYEMFLGPLEQSKIWDTKAIIGARRFIDRVWQLQQKVREEDISQEETSTTNILIENITKAIESGKFNIAVSEFMKYLNFIDQSGGINRQSYETFLKLLAPFAPFITEELWERVGNQYSIHKSTWPQAMTQETVDRQVSIQVMINNKFVGTFLQKEGLTEEEILALLKADERFSRFEGMKIRKIIFKPGKVFHILS